MSDIFFIFQSFHSDCEFFEREKYPKVEKNYNNYSVRKTGQFL